MPSSVPQSSSPWPPAASPEHGTSAHCHMCHQLASKSPLPDILGHLISRAGERQDVNLYLNSTTFQYPMAQSMPLTLLVTGHMVLLKASGLRLVGPSLSDPLLTCLQLCFTWFDCDSNFSN